MSEIVENVTLEMTNVLTYRGKVTQQQMAVIAKEMNDIITASGAKKTMIGVSATHNIVGQGANTTMDMEIMYPLDRSIVVSAPYKIKPIFRLGNAVKIRHKGNPALFQDSISKLMKYIDENGLMPITDSYNVTIQEPQSTTDIENLIVDFYIGVSDNIL